MGAIGPAFLGRERAPVWAETLALCTSIGVGAALLVFAAHYCRYGYDVTDEGADLVTISNPWHYPSSITQFGFLYNPLFRFFHGDIFALRLANLAITFSLAWFMWVVCLKGMWKSPNSGDTGSWRLFGYGFALSASSLAYLQPWLPTPDYDSLALQALLLGASGMVLAARSEPRRAWTGWLLIGTAGWMSFMAKPTTAIGLALVVVLYFLFVPIRKFRMLLTAALVACALFVLGGLLIDHSVVRFISRLVMAVGDAREVQSGHTIGNAVRIDSFHLEAPEIRLLAASALAVLGGTLLSFSTREAFRTAGSLALVAVLGCGVLYLTSDRASQIVPTRFQGLQYWGAAIGALAAAFVACVMPSKRLLSFKAGGRALSFAILPLAYAFGSNVNNWLGASQAAVFWVLAAATCFGAIAGRQIPLACVLPLASFAQLCTGGLLLLSVTHPYRSPRPLGVEGVAVSIGTNGSVLVVSRDVSDYLVHLKQIASKTGYRPGDPVLDLTGHYPGALFAIGATSVGRTWMIGGYKGSEALALTSLSRVNPAELKAAWVLTEPTGPRCLPQTILSNFGLQLTRDYFEAGTLGSPKADYPEEYEQHLYRASSANHLETKTTTPKELPTR